MSRILSFDTSNYTTSACLLDTEQGVVWERRLPLPVDNGKCGLRQSDAVFHHVKNLGVLFNDVPKSGIDCVAASRCPSERENSYMPCFTVGVSFASSLSSLLSVPLYLCSHQKNHIMAALVSSKNTRLAAGGFFAYHVSGGTTDILLCRAGKDVFSVSKIGGTADISCGQLVDRTGIMLGFDFPCGKAVEKAAKGDLSGKIKLADRDGYYNFSGFQNKAQKLYESESAAEVCRFVLDTIYSFLLQSVDKMRGLYGDFPVIMSGGVMSNAKISAALVSARDGIYFSDPAYSVDNAMGTAYMCAAGRGEFNG